jgi:hypothetical protein
MYNEVIIDSVLEQAHAQSDAIFCSCIVFFFNTNMLCFLFFKTLYLWTAAYVSSLSISFSDFLVRFALSS